mmetsp:Transcript_4225/g.8989  ORF Transcript_4225/g.8989 Transcript_4225/m.8989 type:complete len:329 (+) Transcript_4225:79-1065(+)
MRALITGAAGFLGQKLAKKLIADGTVSELILVDIVAASIPESSITTNVITADFSKKEEVVKAIESKPDVIYHLAAIVSGDAEKNFELGYTINVDGLKYLLDAIKADESYTPRLVLASSAAVFGAPVPDPIPDTFHRTPRTSYGTQKSICELYLDDYSRKGYVDGVALRFPTISVRPGKPNKAASSFFSGIIREPLSGVEAVCPVDRSIRHPVVSPRKAVEFLILASTLPADKLKDGRAITMPALTVSVGEMIDALERKAGKEVVALIKMEKDDFINTIIGNWQFHFDTKRAESLGFEGNKTFDEIVQVHIDDELGGAVHVSKKQNTGE